MAWLTFGRQRLRNPTVTAAPFQCRREELTIRGTEYRPEGTHLPIAIVCHGFMATQATVRRYAKTLAGLGYAAYCFDFCGGCVANGKSDGTTTEMSVLTEVRDLEAVMAYTRAQSHNDPKRILLMGCSQGGFVSALTAAKQEAGISKLVLFYPALCIPDDARAGKMMFASFDPDNPPERIRCGPMKLGKCYVTDVIDMDAFAAIQGYSGDVLIVHGTEDAIVAPEYAQRAYETYQSAGKCRQVTLKRIEGGKHGFSKKHDAIALEQLRAFAALPQ